MKKVTLTSLKGGKVYTYEVDDLRIRMRPVLSERYRRVKRELDEFYGATLSHPATLLMLLKSYEAIPVKPELSLS